MKQHRMMENIILQCFSVLAPLHVLMTLSALVGGRVNDLQVCVMAGRKRRYFLIVVGFFSVH